MPTYSVAMCNLDMAGTIEQSLRRLLEQIDDRFEIVVVDGGSTDGSIEILQQLDGKYDALSPVFLDRDPDRTLGEDRNTACRHASGEYIIDSVDVDDLYYKHALTDFVELFEQIEPYFERLFRFHGISLAVTPRTLLVDEYPYRPLDRCEDRDLWRRLFADNRILWFTHGSVSRSIGYDRDLLEKIAVDLEEKACDFQAGITLTSCCRYALSTDHYYILERERSTPVTLLKRFYDLATYPIAYYDALRRPDQFKAPSEFEDLPKLERAIYENRVGLSELEERYDVNTSRLSEEGYQRLSEPRSIVGEG